MINQSLRQNVADKSKAIYSQADDLSGGALSALTRAARHFSETQAPQAAAGMAYYALFSLFPLLLALIAVGSFVLESQQVQQQLLQVIGDVIPVSPELIRQNIRRVLELRGPVGLASIIGLLWSATGVFNTLAYNINQAWEKGEARSFWKRRLVALGIVGGLAALLIVSVIATAIFDLLSQFSVPIGGVSFYQDSFLETISELLPIFFRLLIFLGLYRWVPNTEVRWMEALWGAVVASLGWQVTTIAFTWYLGSGLVQYEIVYGSLGTIIGLMFWIYLGSLITLFGAHLSAAIGQRNQ